MDDTWPGEFRFNFGAGDTWPGEFCFNFGADDTWPGEFRSNFGAKAAASFVSMPGQVTPGQASLIQFRGCNEINFNFGTDDTWPGEFRLNFGTDGIWPSEFRCNFGMDAKASFVSTSGQMAPGQASFASIPGGVLQRVSLPLLVG